MSTQRRSFFDVERLRAFITTEYLALAAIGFACLLGFLFLRIADLAMGDHTYALDIAILERFRDPADPTQMAGSFWLREAVRDVTALGSFSLLTIIVVLVVLFLLLTRQIGPALLVLVSVLSGAVFSEWLKEIFARPRPEFSVIAQEMSASFPSGHAMLSAVTYLTIGALLARFTQSRRLRLFYIAAAVVLTVLVGFTRIVLGVHFPSDVLAGWALGAAWAMLFSAIAYFLSQRGQV